MPQADDRSGPETLTSPSRASPGEPVKLVRRLAAIGYDSLLILAIWMLGAAVVVVAAGEPIASGNPLFQVYLLALAMAYFGSCWFLGGQTVGMRAWSVRLESIEGALAWRQILIRLAVGLVSMLAMGAGFAWSWIRTDRATWHDLASGTRIVGLNRPPTTDQARRSSQ